MNPAATSVHKTVIVGQLTPAVLRLARRIGVGRLVYEENQLDRLPDDMETRHLTVSCDDRLVFWEQMVRDRVSRYYAQQRETLCTPLARLGVSERAFGNYFREWLIGAVKQDVRLILLGELFFPDADIVYLFRRADLASLMLTRGLVLRAPHCRSLGQILVYLLGPAAWLLFWALPRVRNRRQARLVFEQIYPHYFSNNEFLWLHEYFSKAPWKTLYFLPDDKSEMFEQLSKQRSEILTDRDLSLPTREALRVLRSWAYSVFWALSSRGLPLALTCIYPRFFYFRARYRALCHAADFKFFLKLRGDVDVCSSLVREELDSRDVQTIGYSHTTYYHGGGEPPREIDFDYYGYSGVDELEFYWGRQMPVSGVKYILAGQMSVERSAAQRTWGDLGVHEASPLAVGIFPTTYSDVSLSLGREQVAKFIEISLGCASLCGQARILFKLKARDPWIERLIDHWSEKLRIKPVLAFHGDADGRCHRLSSVESYELIDFGLVLAPSTCAFELLALEKKILVFEPVRARPHPLKKHTPLLVAYDAESFRNQFLQIADMSAAVYRDYLRPTAEYCGKRADGRLIASFFEQIKGLMDSEPGPAHNFTLAATGAPESIEKPVKKLVQPSSKS